MGNFAQIFVQKIVQVANNTKFASCHPSTTRRTCKRKVCIKKREVYDTSQNAPPLYDFCGYWCGLSRLPASALTLLSRPLASLRVPVRLRHAPSL